MNLDFDQTIEKVTEETKEFAETAHVKTNEFHENYVSKVIPEMGKYGNVAKFAAEMIPGVSEYNAIKDGDWQAFAISAGLDIAGFAIGSLTAGVGYAAIKGGSSLAQSGVKATTKEIMDYSSKKVIKEVAEAGAKKVVKETAEAGAKKVVKETAEAGAKKVVKETAEASTEKVVKETLENSAKGAMKEVDEIAQIVKNKFKGVEREEKVLKELIDKYGDENIIREALIRDSKGIPIKDVITNEARRIDIVVTKGKEVIQSIEVTSETASKVLQSAKEIRILEQAKELGGAFIKNPRTGELIKFGENIVTEIVRLV